MDTELTQPEVTDPILDALEQVVAVGRANVTSWMEVMERVELVRKERSRGVPYTSMDLPDGPRLVDALAHNLQNLNAAATLLRNASIQALHAEGLSLAEIARRFGVSRQWVSRLLAGLEGATPVDDLDLEETDESGH